MKPGTSAVALFFMLLVTGGVAAQPQPSTQPPPVPGPDLEVLSVQLDTPPPAWFEGVPRNALVDVTLRNRGDVDAGSYQVIFRWSVPGSADAPLNGNVSNSFDASEVPLRAGQHATYRFHWRLQPGQVGLGTVRVTVQVVGSGGAAGGGGMGDTNPNNNVGSAAVFVARHALAWEAEGTPRALHPDEATFVRFTLRNLGNVDETVGLALGGSQGLGGNRLRAQLATSQVMAPASGTATTTLFIDYEYDYDSSPFSARFPVRATAAYGRVMEALTPTITNTDTRLDLQAFTATLTGSPAVAYAPAGSPTTLEWTAKNTGKEIDTYLVTAEAGAGWTVEAQPPRLGLSPGEQTVLRVAVAPSPELPAGSGTQVVLRLRSEHPVPEVNASRPLLVSGPAARILGLQPAPRIYRGDSPPLQVHWFNQGDAPLPGGTLAVTAHLSDGSALAMGKPVAALAPGQEQRTEIRWGPLGVPGTVRYDVRWEGAGAPASPMASVQAWVHDPKIEILAPAPHNGTPGETVAYTVPPHVFQVRNNGATAQNLTLLAFSPGGAQLLGPSRFTLAPGEQRSVAVRQTLPSPTRQAAVPLELKVTAEDRPDLEWKASALTSILDRHAPRVTVPSRPADWDLASPLPVAATAVDDGEVASVQVIVTPPAGANQTVPLTLGTDAVWRGQVRFAAAGNHTLRIASADAAGNAGVAVGWRVTVHPAPVPRIDLVLPASGSWPVATPLNLTVSGTSAPSIEYEVEQGGGVRSAGTAAVVDGRAQVPLRGLDSGLAVLRIKAIGMHRETVAAAFDVNLLADGAGPAPPTPTASETRSQRPTPPGGVAALLAAASVALWVWRRWT